MQCVGWPELFRKHPGGSGQRRLEVTYSKIRPWLFWKMGVPASIWLMRWLCPLWDLALIMGGSCFISTRLWSILKAWLFWCWCAAVGGVPFELGQLARWWRCLFGRSHVSRNMQLDYVVPFLVGWSDT